MKFLKSIPVLSLLFVFSLSYNLNHSLSNDFIIAKKNVVPLSHHNHPEIKGFSYSYGNVDARKAIDDTTGYVFENEDVYFMDISPVSRLFLIRVQAEFTPSSQANKNGGKNYDSRFDLYSGYIHTNVYQKIDGNKKSSSLHMKNYWPKSDDDFTATITSNFGLTYNFNSTFGAGIEVSNGMTFKADNNIGRGFSLSYSKSTAITMPEPVISSQNFSSVNNAQWHYQYTETGKVTYNLETFFLFEAKNDGQGYQPYSFGFDVDIEMNNVAYRHLWWEQHDVNHYTNNDSYGLYE